MEIRDGFMYLGWFLAVIWLFQVTVSLVLGLPGAARAARQIELNEREVAMNEKERSAQ